jgi:hypothetical protein
MHNNTLQKQRVSNADLDNQIGGHGHLPNRSYERHFNNLYSQH